MMRPTEEDWAAHRAAKAAAASAPPPSARPSRLAAAEWYVGIDGEPVGPIDIGYLKTQVARGKVGLSSLVWREELPDWKPLESFPELRQLVAGEQAPVPAAKVSDPIALTREPDEVADGTRPSPIAGVAAGAPAPPADSPAQAVPVGEPTPPSGVAALQPPPAAATIPMADAAPDSSAQPVVAGPSADTGVAATPGPLAAAAQVEPPAGTARSELSGASGDAWPFGEQKPARSEPLPDSEVLAAAGVRPRRKGKMHPMAWALIAMMTAFGGVSAWFIFG